MATLDWPTSYPFRPTRMTWGASTPKSAWAGFFTGQSQSISHLADRLRVEIELPPCSYAEAGLRESYIMGIASSGDWVRLWHFHRPQPLGDMRGATVVQRDEAAGARTIRVRGGTTATNLLTGTQAFDSTADWTPTNGLTVTANTHVRPNNTPMSADTLTDPNTSVSSYDSQSITVANDSQTYTGSVYVRKTSGGTSRTVELSLWLTGGTAVDSVLRVNTDTGAILSGTGVSTLTTDGLYYRISTSLANNATGNTALETRIYPARCAHGSSTVDGTLTGDAVFWGAQLEPGATVTTYEGTPELIGGDIIGVGSQLLITGYAGDAQGGLPYLVVPLALPLRQAVTAGDVVTWDRPTGNFQLLGDLSQVQYMPARWQDAITLQFVEAY